MRTEIKRLHQRMKTTIVYVTHDQIEAMTLATKIAVLKDGVLQQFGTPAEIYNNPANMFVADFMGSPAMNLLTGDDRRRMATASTVALDRGRTARPLRLPIAGRDGLAGHAGQRGDLRHPAGSADRPDGADRNARSLADGDCHHRSGGAGRVRYLCRHHASAARRSWRACAPMRSIQPGQTTPLAFNLDKAVFFDPQSQVRLA